jgi:hypothetical protein
MPKFLDAHKMGDLDEEALKKAQQSPPDEFGITHENIMYNENEDKLYCLLNAPNKDAVQKHHGKFGLNCEWITEVKTTA